MLVKEYSLIFFKLSKYASSVVSSSRDKISMFVTSVSEDLEEECREAMLHDNMDLARLIVHENQVEARRKRKRGREGKKPRPLKQAGSSTCRSSFEVKDRPKFNKGNQHSGNTTSSSNTNTKGNKSFPKKGNDRKPQHNRKSCGKCGRLHGGEFMVGYIACYGCGKCGHMIWDCPHVKNQANADTQPRPNPTTAVEPPKRNRFYALKGREDQEKLADVVTGTLSFLFLCMNC